MNPLKYPLFADENIDPEVIIFLREAGYDIQSVQEESMMGQSDLAVLRYAHQHGRVVLTHDSDFGTLVILEGQPFIGIIYLRPAHFQSKFTINSLKSLMAQALDVKPSFIVVVEQKDGVVRIRVRQM